MLGFPRRQPPGFDMKTSDPQIVNALNRMHRELETLYRLCGITPPWAGPEATSSRAPHWCPQCPSWGFQSQADLDHHVRVDHGGE